MRQPLPAPRSPRRISPRSCASRACRNISAPVQALARHQPRHRPERDRRADRRQRRRKIDADQGHDRRARRRPRAASSSATAKSTSPTIRSAWPTISRSRPSTRTARSPRSSRSGATSSSAARSPTASASSTSRKEKEIADDILKRAIGFRGVGITVDSTVANLSGGERQGIAIGRAMHYNADLIILDEPTAALGRRRGAQGPRFRPAHKGLRPRLHLHRAQPRPCARGRRPPDRARPRRDRLARSCPRTCR